MTEATATTLKFLLTSSSGPWWLTKQKFLASEFSFLLSISPFLRGRLNMTVAMIVFHGYQHHFRGSCSCLYIALKPRSRSGLQCRGSRSSCSSEPFLALKQTLGGLFLHLKKLARGRSSWGLHAAHQIWAGDSGQSLKKYS